MSLIAAGMELSENMECNGTGGGWLTLVLLCTPRRSTSDSRRREGGAPQRQAMRVGTFYNDEQSAKDGTEDVMARK